MSIDILSRLQKVRARAAAGGIPVRRKDAYLYSLLAECLSICEDVRAHGLHDEFREAVRTSAQLRDLSPSGRNRCYVERASDEFVLVARAVLEGADNRNSVYRYAATIREADRRGIHSDTLADWLSQNGGANALFRRRPVSAQSRTTRTLHLNSPIEIPKDGPFTLTIVDDGSGFYDVVPATLRVAAE